MQKGKVTKGSNSSSKKRKKQALGRGLDALIPDIESIADPQKDYFHCDINLIHPNRYQPRLQFPQDEMDELCRSIKEKGIIQPLLVRKDSSGYELIAGERRLRGAKKAGLNQVPVVIRNASDSDILEMSIVENIQRENLNPLEEAEAYYQLINKFNLTQDEAAGRVGKSRSAVANLLRLRQLPEQIKASIKDGTLSMGHARALLGTETSARQIEAWRAVVSKEMSVRETENLIKRLSRKTDKPKASAMSSEEIYLSDLEDKLSRHFGTKVRIIKRGKKGRVEVEFYSDQDLDRLIGLLK